MGAKLTACAVAIAVWAALASGQEPAPRTSDTRDQSDNFDLEGVPLRLHLRKGDNPYA